MQEDELISSLAFRQFLSKDETPVIRLLQKAKKHVLSHRIVYADFYEIILPEDTISFAAYMKIRKDEINNYAVSKLTHSFLETFL